MKNAADKSGWIKPVEPTRNIIAKIREQQRAPAPDSYIVPCAGGLAFRRGEYITWTGRGEHRITGLTDTVLTIRPHALWLEPINRRIEDWLIFPLSDCASFAQRVVKKAFRRAPSGEAQ